MCIKLKNLNKPNNNQTYSLFFEKLNFYVPENQSYVKKSVNITCTVINLNSI